VVGFPCNQFGAQEPGTHREICEFTSSKYSVTFPLMAKVDVNGPGRTPLFERLSQTADADGVSGDVRWNFEKFLVDEAGNVQRFSTRVAPDALPVCNGSTSVGVPQVHQRDSKEQAGDDLGEMQDQSFAKGQRLPGSGVRS